MICSLKTINAVVIYHSGYRHTERMAADIADKHAVSVSRRALAW